MYRQVTHNPNKYLRNIQQGAVVGSFKLDIRTVYDAVGSSCTGWLWWSRTWVGLTMILLIPLSALFCLGRWEFGRTGYLWDMPNLNQPNQGMWPPEPPCTLCTSHLIPTNHKSGHGLFISLGLSLVLSRLQLVRHRTRHFLVASVCKVLKKEGQKWKADYILYCETDSPKQGFSWENWNQWN